MFCMRPLLTGEAKPEAANPKRCLICKKTHSNAEPLYKAFTPMREEYVACRPCIEDGKTPY